jgi:DNA primase
MTYQDVLNQANGRDEYTIKCAFHTSRQPDGTLGPEKTPSLGISLKKGVFHCFGCKTKGSLIKLKSLLDGITYQEASWQLYKGEIPEHLLNSFTTEETEETEYIYPESQLALYPLAGEIRERGIEEMESNLYDVRRDQEDNLYLPIRDRLGCLRGGQVRYKDKEERYDQFLYWKGGSYFFGEHLVPDKEFRLIICEGALDAVKLSGVLGVVTLAYLGSNLSKRQRQKLTTFPIKEITFWSDNDDVGFKAMKDSYKYLKGLTAGEVYGIKYHLGDPKDPSDTNTNTIQRLYEERKWVPLIT